MYSICNFIWPQVISFFLDQNDHISVLIQLLSVGSFTEDRLFNFTSGSASRRPACDGKVLICLPHL